MKNIIYFLFFFVFFNMSAQQLDFKRSFGEIKFYQNEERISLDEALKIVDSNKEALEELERAKTNRFYSLVFATVGGAFIGFPIGMSLAGEDMNWTLAGIGAGLVGISIPFFTSYNKRAKNAVEIYNRGLRKNEVQPTLSFNVNAQGFGIKLNF